MYSFDRCMFISLLLPFTLLALPSGSSVISGGAKVLTPNAREVTVSTQEDVNIIDWSCFDLDNGESITFSRTGGNASDKYHVFNKVTGARTTISGGVNGGKNALIYIVNPNGVIVGPSGTIITGGIFLSGLNLSGSFSPDLEGSYTGTGTVSVSGSVTATLYDAIFLGYRVMTSPESTVTAKGTVAIGAGSRMVFKPLDEERIYIETSREEVVHEGTISAASIFMNTDGNIYSLAINQEGLIKATSCNTSNGRIKLIANANKNIKETSERGQSIVVECFSANSYIPCAEVFIPSMITEVTTPFNYDGIYELFYRMDTFGMYDWYLFHSNDFWLKHTYTAP